MSNPNTLRLSRASSRSVDRCAIDEFGIPGIVLMENAGRGIAELLITLGCRGPVVICAGKGNNGGDGFVIARHLENRGIAVQVWLACDPAELTGDAAANLRILLAAGTPVEVLAPTKNSNAFSADLSGSDWVVDALLGTGMTGEVREPCRSMINEINRIAGPRKLAVDIPSGFDCDTGQTFGCCVRADHTATMVARKVGFDAPGAVEWTGVVHVIDIGVPRKLIDRLHATSSNPPQLST